MMCFETTHLKQFTAR